MSENEKKVQLEQYQMQPIQRGSQAPPNTQYSGQPPPGVYPPPGTQYVGQPDAQPQSGVPPGAQYGGQPGVQPPQDAPYGWQPGIQPQPGVLPTPGVPPQPGVKPPPGTQYGIQPQVQYAQPGQPGQPPMMAQPGVPGATQPLSAQWMSMPQAPVGCPPGLEYLTQIDQLLVHQKVEKAEVFTGLEFENKYAIKNSMGQRVYYAHEESEDCQRQCCGPQRGFTMHITDNMDQEVIRVVREFKCCAGWKCCAFSDCCAMEVAVEAPVGTIVGYVRQTVSLCSPMYEILGTDRNCILKINGPCCMCQNACCTNDIEFQIHSKDDAAIGRISKQWGGIYKESYTTADNFTLSFPLDLDVRVKSTLLGAVFLIDFMYFEQKPERPNRNRRRRRR